MPAARYPLAVVVGPAAGVAADLLIATMYTQVELAISGSAARRHRRASMGGGGGAKAADGAYSATLVGR
jgi:hypothetical protein